MFCVPGWFTPLIQSLVQVQVWQTLGSAWTWCAGVVGSVCMQYLVCSETCALYSLQCAVCGVWFAGCIVQYAMCSLNCALCILCNFQMTSLVRQVCDEQHSVFRCLEPRVCSVCSVLFKFLILGFVYSVHFGMGVMRFHCFQCAGCVGFGAHIAYWRVCSELRTVDWVQRIIVL